MKKQFLFLLGSARPNGNTEVLARHAAQSLPASIEKVWLRLMDHPLPPFEDIRHDETRRYSLGNENERILLGATLAASDIVIASPVYWYSVSAATKQYIDYWSAWMRLEDVDFKKRMAGKTLWGVAAYSDDDPKYAQPLVDTLRLSAEYMQMRWGRVLLGYGNRPGDVLHDAPSLERAATFFDTTAPATGV